MNTISLWSVLSCMRKSRIAPYWTQTGIPTIIAKTLRDIDADLEEILNTRCKFSQLAGLDLSGIDPLALLYQTGYLTIKKLNNRTDTVTLGVPNKGVNFNKATRHLDKPVIGRISPD